MSTADVILVTFVGTLVLAVVVFFAVKGINAVWNLAITLRDAVKSATTVLGLVHGEMAYMRQITQQATQGTEWVPQTPPPVGRTGTMPPPFPTREWQTYPVPDAKLEDTDHSLLEQTDQEVMDAQAREELRAKGIEPDLDDERSPAVVEEA